MIQLSFVVGFLLIALGVGGYVITSMVSVTALIPAFFGILIVLAAITARVEGRRRMAMHVAMGVALVGILGSIDGLVQVLSGARGAAPTSKAIMASLFIIFLAVGTRSFLAARRR